MKRVLFSILLGLFATMGYAQDIMGKWVTEAGDAQVEFFEHNGKVNGKIVWLQRAPTPKMCTTRTTNAPSGWKATS